ncbi:hypothetical protein SCAR479_08319 [Seiridium cardinale]|uniref:Uncharacterized protein n=1 Tax=Seiridium cardinale TaxID=138064 RepID=A0ABR2XN62_9PEZI
MSMQKSKREELLEKRDHMVQNLKDSKEKIAKIKKHMDKKGNKGKKTQLPSAPGAIKPSQQPSFNTMKRAFSEAISEKISPASEPKKKSKEELVDKRADLVQRRKDRAKGP